MKKEGVPYSSIKKLSRSYSDLDLYHKLLEFEVEWMKLENQKLDKKIKSRYGDMSDMEGEIICD